MSLDNPTSGDELLGMSDDDFANLNAPPAATEAAVVEEDKTGEQVEEPAQVEVVEEAVAEDEAEVGKAQVAESPADEVKTEDAPAGKVEDVDGNKAPEGADAVKDTEKKPEAASPGSSEGGIAEPTPEQATAFYKQVMAPFKANGKTIQLKDPAEVIQLMQMGANYTRKLQDIQPHRKMLLMLQNNDLLDEGKLSYLIDLDKKNPEAIKKLIKDAGIDPMDIDTASEPAYLEGNHRVTDAEAGFHQALNDLTSSQSGKETVQHIHTDWDQASKEVLWESPEIMSVIHEQRESGVYAVITDEVDRQRTLGLIPPGTPFLQAYKDVGDQLAKAGKFGAPAEPEKKDPVAKTVITPKPAVTNGDKANAASPTRTTPRKAEKLVNVLAMSDEEFLKLEPLNGRI